MDESAGSITTAVNPRGVATVTLNRPDKLNAFDDAVIAELREAFAGLAARDDVRVVVLASQGKNFSAGADVAGRDLTPELIEATCEGIARIRVSAEGQEGLGAFLNKRQPDWLAH